VKGIFAVVLRINGSHFSFLVLLFPELLFYDSNSKSKSNCLTPKKKVMNFVKQNVYWLIYLLIMGGMLALAIIFG
jgi:hypothetical protein